MVLAGATASQAAILWDLNTNDENPRGQGAVSNFTALGVTEDLTGSGVSNVIASASGTMTTGAVSLAYQSGTAQDVGDRSLEPDPSINPVLFDYLYLAIGGPVTFQISGLSSELLANTEYSFYLIGLGDAADQTAMFTFGSTTLTTTSADPAAKFTFTTGVTVDDTLDFTWAREGANTYSGFNGFAIAAVPEPATIGLYALFGATLFMLRKSRIRRKWMKEQ